MTALRHFLIATALGFTPLAVAKAHVTAQPNEAIAGSYFVTSFSVPHGCNGSSTVALRVKIPDGVIAVKPQMKPGWQVEIKKKKLDTPVAAGHDTTITETVDEVTWRGGPLPDNLYDTFGMVMKLPNKPDTTLNFLTVQECQEGVNRWIGIPAENQKRSDLPQPAPFIRLKAAP